MIVASKDIVFHKNTFIWIAIFTGAILLIPLIAMQFTDEVNWSIADFVVMSLLLFGMGSLFVLISRKTAKKHRVYLALIFLVAFLYIWAELAVGVFTSLGD